MTITILVGSLIQNADHYINKYRDYIFLSLVIFIFLTVSFKAINDDGITQDFVKQSNEGKTHFTYLLSGKVIDAKAVFYQSHGSFSYILSELSFKLFHSTFKLLDSASARHIIIPLLLVFFLIPFYFFVKQYFGTFISVASILIFISTPIVIGESFNNLKDVPLLIFISLSLFSFITWFCSNKIKYLYFFFLYGALAICIKVYALIIFAILFFWLLILKCTKSFSKHNYYRKNLLKHIVLGCFLLVVIFIVFFKPAFWGVQNKISYLQFWLIMTKILYISDSWTWNAYTFQQMFYRMPLLMLISFALGLLSLILSKKKNIISVFFIVWLLMHLILHCLPRLGLYQQVRLFIACTVPFSIISAVGISQVRSLFKNNYLAIGLLISTVMLNLYGIISVYPYERCYFNFFAGGLKGAQEKRIKHAYDVQFDSQKEVSYWFDLNAKPNAKVIVLYNRSIVYDMLGYMVKSHLRRNDIQVKGSYDIRKESVKRNTYIVFIPLPELFEQRQFIEQKLNFKKVYTIERQKGEIASIYYKM